MSVVVVAELRYGADHSARRRTNHSRIDALVEEIEPLDFDLRAAATYGRVRAQLEAGGTPIGPNDMLIAAHALSRGLTVVTDNTAEFRRVKGLKVETGGISSACSSMPAVRAPVSALRRPRCRARAQNRQPCSRKSSSSVIERTPIAEHTSGMFGLSALPVAASAVTTAHP